MTSELVFHLENKPGALSKIASTLGKSGINIEGGSGMTLKEKGRICLLVDDTNSAETALKDASIEYEKKEVLSVKLKDEAGSLARLTDAFAKENINLDTFYITMDGRQIFAMDKLEEAKKIASKMGIL